MIPGNLINQDFPDITAIEWERRHKEKVRQMELGAIGYIRRTGNRYEIKRLNDILRQERKDGPQEDKRIYVRNR